MAAGPYADPDDLSPLSVAQLRAVCAVADRLSFTAAAHDLGLTQPAVSRLVTGAERRLGLRARAIDGALECGVLQADWFA